MLAIFVNVLIQNCFFFHSILNTLQKQYNTLTAGLFSVRDYNLQAKKLISCIWHGFEHYLDPFNALVFFKTG